MKRGLELVFQFIKIWISHVSKEDSDVLSMKNKEIKVLFKLLQFEFQKMEKIILRILSSNTGILNFR